MKKTTTRTSRTRRTPGHPARNPLPAVRGPISVPGAAAPDGSTFIEPAERQGMIAEAAYLRPKSAVSIAENDIEHLLPSPSTPALGGD